jgi:hypothetical protein
MRRTRVALTVPQAGVADALQLGGRAEPGFDLADRYREKPGKDKLGKD